MISRRQALLGAVGVAVGRKVPPRPIRGLNADVIICDEASFWPASGEWLPNIWPNQAAMILGRLKSGEIYVYPIAPASNDSEVSVRWVETPS